MDGSAHSGGETLNRVIVPGRCVRVSGETARVSIPGHAAPVEPRIEVTKEGETVQAIDVVCGCGQRIRIRCKYAKQG